MSTPHQRECQAWRERLADFLEGRLTSEDQRRMDQHLSRCLSCRDLLEVVRGKREVLSTEERESLTRRIVARTAGSACKRAHELLGARTDGSLEAPKRELLEEHLAHCSQCRLLADTLQWLLPELGEMREVQPDPWFVADVVRATRGVRRERFPWLARLKQWWERSLANPLFEWEAAYVGALLVVTMMGTPGPILHTVVVQARVFAQSGLIALQRESSVPLEVAQHRVTTLAEDVWSATGGSVASKTRGILGRLGAVRDRFSVATVALRMHGRAFIQDMGNREFLRATLHLGEMGNDLKQLWRGGDRGDEDRHGTAG